MTTSSNLTSGQKFYQEQVAALEAHDIDGLMEQYHDDAVVIGFDFTIRAARRCASISRRILPDWAA